MRREIVAAFRRGSMDADRCLQTYFNQGETEILPFEAVVYLTSRVLAEREGWRKIAGDGAELSLEWLCQTDREDMKQWIEQGRAFFFPVAVLEEEVR